MWPVKKVEQLKTYLRAVRYACVHKKLLGLKHTLFPIPLQLYVYLLLY